MHETRTKVSSSSFYENKQRLPFVFLACFSLLSKIDYCLGRSNRDGCCSSYIPAVGVRNVF
jgi:hypothetical protein